MKLFPKLLVLLKIVFIFVAVFIVLNQGLSNPQVAAYTLLEKANDIFLDPNVKLSPGNTQTVVAGSMITYTHTLTNTGDTTDTFTIDVVSSQSWLMNLQGSLYFPGTLGSMTGSMSSGSLQLPLQVQAGLSATIQIGLSIPPTATGGVIDITTITATSQMSPTINAVAVNTTTIQPETHTLFMPMVIKSGDPVAEFGVDYSFTLAGSDAITEDLRLAKDMGAGWVRFWVSWPLVEPSPGQYNWEYVDHVLEHLSKQDMNVILVVYAAPNWAADLDCGPISDIDAFKGFLALLVARYGSTVDAWEFTNEPDGADPDSLEHRPINGCWASWPQEYAEQLGVFYHQIKARDPGSLILFGGLAYDNWAHFDRNFFENTLQYGAGQYFDIVSLHYYPINPNEFPTMADKANEIQDTMARNGVVGKRIWITETGMWINLNGSLEKQRNFIFKEFSRGFCNGVDHIFYFGVKEYPPERELVTHRWLINLQHEPDNAYDTYQNFAAKIGGTTCAGNYLNVPEGIEAYQFTESDRQVYVLWSNDQSQSVTIPATNIATFTSRDGDLTSELPIQNDQVTFVVSFTPVIVEVFE